MKKLLLVVVFLTGGTLGIGPYFLGAEVEKGIKESIQRLNGLKIGKFSIENYKRSWFSSSFSLTLKPDAKPSAIDKKYLTQYTGAKIKSDGSIVNRIKVFHGPVSINSESTIGPKSGSIVLLNSEYLKSVMTFKLTGNTEFQFIIKKPIDFKADIGEKLHIKAHSGRLLVTVNQYEEPVAIDAELNEFVAIDKDGSFHLGKLTYNVYEVGQYKELILLSGKSEMKNIKLTDKNGKTAYALGTMVWTFDSNIKQKKVSADIDVKVKNAKIRDYAISDFHVPLHIKNLDADTLAEINRLQREMKFNPQTAIQTQQLIGMQAVGLLKQSPEIIINTARVTSQHGVGTAKVNGKYDSKKFVGMNFLASVDLKANVVLPEKMVRSIISRMDTGKGNTVTPSAGNGNNSASSGTAKATGNPDALIQKMITDGGFVRDGKNLKLDFDFRKRFSHLVNPK